MKMLCRYCAQNPSPVGGHMSMKGYLVSTQNLCEGCGQLIPCFMPVDKQNSMADNKHEVQKDAESIECSESTSGSSISTPELMQALQMNKDLQPFKTDQQLTVDDAQSQFIDTAQQQEHPPETTRKISHIHGFNSKLFADIDTTGFPRTIFTSATRENEPKDLNSPSKQLELNLNQATLCNPHATLIKPGLVKKLRDKIEYGIIHDGPRKYSEVNTLNLDENRAICLTKSIQTQVYENEEAVSLHLNGLGRNAFTRSQRPTTLLHGDQNVHKVMRSTNTTTNVHMNKNAKNINAVKCEKKMPASLYEELSAAVKLHGSRQIDKNRQTENVFVSSNLASNSKNAQKDLSVGKNSTIDNITSIIPDVKDSPAGSTALLKLKDQKVPTADRFSKNSCYEKGQNTNLSALQKVSEYNQANPN
ncbi:uncharacterized protein LOC119689444 isoform X1 [Teleopsis dalmanni]|uniref:uncharacterized protein LOC119689444 isoform X1 n=1 Tax=Teleopsis dalmanni TaxID=139649 RepID=UPI0018CD0CCD|nr:uncharacterized protein LOC119689444 isoform X1 [Teleopsis dalmanni]